jgi:tRNA pseudouridine55 synthase
VPSKSEVENALVQLTGQITQTPSMYSAIKINGKEAYKRARAGETVVMPSRQVTIHENVLINYEYPTMSLSSKVSSGTYMRTLAQDLGKLLGTGAYLSGLMRTEVGDYSLDNAVQLDSADVPTVEQKLGEISA